MRALTVRQPWAWAIVHGGKDVENRTRNVAGGYRGPVAIHAGLAERDPGFQDPTFGAAFLAATKAAETTADLEDICRGPLTRGAIVGVVDLVDVHPGTGCGCSPWAVQGWLDSSDPVHHLVLANPRPARGADPGAGDARPLDTTPGRGRPAAGGDPVNVVVSKMLPIKPPPGEIGRRIVRHGLADVLAWLGEQLGPRPEEVTHAIASVDPGDRWAVGVLFVSEEYHERLRRAAGIADLNAPDRATRRAAEVAWLVQHQAHRRAALIAGPKAGAE